MDLDYRALGNAGLWCVGRLQTDADRARVVDGLTVSGDLAHGGEATPSELADLIKRLQPRWFLLRDAHSSDGVKFLQPRYAMSFLKGPMTRVELRRALVARGSATSAAPAAGSPEGNAAPKEAAA